MSEQVRVSGSAMVTRTSGADTAEVTVTLDMLLNARDALVRVGSKAVGTSHLRGFTHPVSLWTLHEIDAMIQAIVYANRPIRSYFKGETATRTADLLPPPLGYSWCPACLGCLNRSQTCPTCDGNRVVRVQS